MQQRGPGSIAGLVIIIKLIINVVMIIIKLITLDTMVHDHHANLVLIAGLIFILITLAYD